MDLADGIDALLRPEGGWDVARPGTVAAIERVGAAIVAPLVLAYRLRIVSFGAAGQILSVIPGAPGVLLRRAWYGATLASCGKRLRVMFGTAIRRPETRIGDDCHFGELNRVGLADIGSNFLSSSHVVIVSGRRQHGTERRDLPIRMQPGSVDCVTIGEDVWVGAGATIGADVAAHSVVAMGAVVTRTFPEWSVLGGVPAQVVRERP